MNNHSFDVELLRPIEFITEPDPRTCSFAKDIADYHADVSSFNLNAQVPRDIALQFETAKNLYLYGWFIWRFFTVADHQAFSCLELALRSRYENSIPKKYFPKQKQPGLKAMLEFAIDECHIKNEEFETWRNITLRKARSRYEHNKSQEMHANGLNEIELDYNEIEIEDEDKDWNYVQMLQDILPKQRNQHAHGSVSVDMFHGPRHTIQIVSEIINQIYSAGP